MKTVKVAVVGAGPSGFYAAAALLRADRSTEVSLIERSPVPYGLVRYGVAPDHASLKAVASLLERTGKDPRVAFFGNTQLWRDVTLAELLALHDAVILAIGAPQDRMLGLAREDIEGFYRASQIVGWYNSDPIHCDFTPQFGSGRVCILGHGNVAADIARILLSPPARLSCTDISDKALQSLEQNPVTEIHLVGRRGPAQTRFTPPVIAGLLGLPGVEVVIDAADGSMKDQTTETAQSSAAGEVMQILRDAARASDAHCDRRLRLVFHSTVQMLSSMGGLVHVTLEQGEPPHAALHALQFDAVISATGFELSSDYCQALPLTAGALSNRSGQLIDERGECLPGLYTVGWAARGANGTIGTCRSDAERLVKRILSDVQSASHPNFGGHHALNALLKERQHKATTFPQWLQLDRLEREQGAALGRPRLKMPTAGQLLQAMESTI